MMGTFYFLRHGETDFNNRQLWMGSSDILLNDKGRSQIYSLVPRIKALKIARIYTSSLNRAIESAEIIGREADISAIEVVDGLSERSYGKFEGMPKNDSNYQKLLLSDSPEPYPAFLARVQHTITSLPLSTTCLVVSHSGVFKALLSNKSLIATEKNRCVIDTGELVRVDLAADQVSS